MIKSILEKAEQTVGIIGTVANSIGSEKIPAQRTTPESLDLQEIFDKMKDKGADTVVMEVSSQGLKLSRVAGSEFSIGVFTNFSHDHIGGDEHPDMEDYFVKMLLFHGQKRNADDSCAPDFGKQQLPSFDIRHSKQSRYYGEEDCYPR